MRILLSSLFILIASIAFSQSDADSLLPANQNPVKEKISDGFSSTTDSIKNANKINLPKFGLGKKIKNKKNKNSDQDTTAVTSKDSASFQKKVADNKITKDITSKLNLKAPNDSTQNGLLTDTAKLKKAIPKIDAKEIASDKKDVLENKKDGIVNKAIGDTAKYKQSIPKVDAKEMGEQKKEALTNKKDGLVNKFSADTAKLKNINLQDKATGIKDGVVAKKDALVSENKSKVKSLKPRAIAFAKQQVKAVRPRGSISLGYEYGVLPSVTDGNYPAGGYRTEGRVSFLLVNVPLELTYNYSNIKNTVGLTNYFRLSYDTERYKEQLAEKMNVKNKIQLDQLNKLQAQQEGLMHKMEYLNFLSKNPDFKMPLADSLKNKIPDSDALLDKVKDTIPALPDTSQLGVNNQLGQIDTSMLSQNKLIKQDSILSALGVSRAEYDSINNEIAIIRAKIEQVQAIINNPKTAINPYLSKVQSILSGIQKFEIGLCHPNYSTFLANNIPLQGINMEYFKNEKFFAFSYGTTITTLLFNPNTLQGTMQGARNLYNYFDFGNLEGGRKILSVKGGVGAKENSHLHVGFLLGKGRADYYTPISSDAPADSYSKESNVVIECDAKYKFTQNASLDVVLGKSSIKEEDMTMDQIKRSVNEIFSNYRSYALLTRLNFGIKRTNTKLTFTTRWVDPYFKSFGVGFLRSDNMRYELKAEQPLGKKIKYTIAYRREEDNLLKLYDYQNTLQSINNSLSIKINRQFNIRLNYVPLFRELKSGIISIKDKNQIATAILSFMPRAKKVSSQFNALYSRYDISADSANIHFENITYTHQLQLKKGFKTGMNVSWFKNSLKDTINNDTYLGVLDVGYVAKKGGSFSLGGKVAYKLGMEMQYGFVLKASIKLYKGVFWEAEAEKILIGDYYNSFNVWKIEKFPYYCNTRVVINF